MHKRREAPSFTTNLFLVVIRLHYFQRIFVRPSSPTKVFDPRLVAALYADILTLLTPPPTPSTAKHGGGSSRATTEGGRAGTRR